MDHTFFLVFVVIQQVLTGANDGKYVDYLATEQDLQIGSFVMIADGGTESKPEISTCIGMILSANNDSETYTVLVFDWETKVPLTIDLSKNILWRWPNSALRWSFPIDYADYVPQIVHYHSAVIHKEMDIVDYTLLVKVFGAEIFQHYGADILNHITQHFQNVGPTSRMTQIVKKQWQNIPQRGQDILNGKCDDNHSMNSLSPIIFKGFQPLTLKLTAFQSIPNLNGKTVEKAHGVVVLSENKETFAIPVSVKIDGEMNNIFVELHNIQPPLPKSIINECAALLTDIIQELGTYGDYERFRNNHALVNKLATVVHDVAEEYQSGWGFEVLVDMVHSLYKDGRPTLISQYAERWFHGIGRFLA